ncbi:MAG: response regulator [Polyangiaceae bacterium]|nr:response regulator [Polyangiaceae bacterium]
MTDVCHGVLLVEDDEAIRLAIADALLDEGFVVETACNGAEALDHLRRRSKLPCVVLLDLMMPIMDGRQFRAEQEKDPVLSQIPVVVLTADASAERKAAELNAAAGIAKPLRLATLLDHVDRFCRP